MNWRSIADSLSWFASQNIQQKRGRNIQKKNPKQGQGAPADFSSPGTNDALDLKAISIRPAPPQYTFIFHFLFFYFPPSPVPFRMNESGKSWLAIFCKGKSKRGGPKWFPILLQDIDHHYTDMYTHTRHARSPFLLSPSLFGTLSKSIDLARGSWLADMNCV